MVRVLEHDTYHDRFEIEFLGDKFFGLFDPEGAR